MGGGGEGGRGTARGEGRVWNQAALGRLAVGAPGAGGRARGRAQAAAAGAAARGLRSRGTLGRGQGKAPGVLGRARAATRGRCE